MVELFAKITDKSFIIDILLGSKPGTIFAKKSSKVVFGLVSEYASESYLHIPCYSNNNVRENTETDFADSMQ